MILTDFLVARCLETLESEACQYRRRADGGVVCECESPSAPAFQAMQLLELIQRSVSAAGVREPLLRVLADAYATHPDYQSEWHSLSTSSRG